MKSFIPRGTKASCRRCSGQRAYIEMEELAELQHNQALECFKIAEAMRIWQARNPDLVKLPD